MEIALGWNPRERCVTKQLPKHTGTLAQPRASPVMEAALHGQENDGHNVKAQLISIVSPIHAEANPFGTDGKEKTKKLTGAS